MVCDKWLKYRALVYFKHISEKVFSWNDQGLFNWKINSVFSP